jgi:cAMP-dependent protein kinase regulator
MQRLWTLLASFTVLCDLNTKDLTALVNSAVLTHVDPYEVVIVQGDVGRNCYFVEDGELAVLEKGEEVARIGRGRFFGEISLINNCPCTATVSALTYCTLWAIGRDTFNKILLPHLTKKRRLFVTFLNTVPLFASLRQYEIAVIADVVHSKTFNNGDSVVLEGESGTAFYIVMKGIVATTSGNGAFGEGEYFGEASLLRGQPLQSSVACGPVTLLKIEREDFQKFIWSPCKKTLQRKVFFCFFVWFFFLLCMTNNLFILFIFYYIKVALVGREISLPEKT